MRREIHGLVELSGLANDLAERLDPGRIVALSGPLGSGKTALVREIALRLGASPSTVRSPSFTIVNVYSAADGKVLYHVDLYRVLTAADLDSIDLEEILFDPDAISFVEWPDIIRGLLPEDAIWVHLDFDPGGDPDVRIVRVSGVELPRKDTRA